MESFRTYTANDMAKIYCAKCNGCGDCCHGMTDTIHLDPYDVEQLRRHLGRRFEDMLQHEIGLHVDQGMVLPHLQFTDNVCPFLDQDNRCRIHAFRPGFCRLFPLGRNYDADTHSFQYFVVDAGCDMPGKMKVKISKWLGIPNLARYEQFVAEWHYFCRDVQKKLAEMENKVAEESSRQQSDSSAGASQPSQYASAINRFLLTVFYSTPYPPEKDFYDLFYLRLKRAREAVL